jgi:hypothetical protein
LDAKPNWNEMLFHLKQAYRGQGLVGGWVPLVRAAMERIIEKAGEVEVTASAVVGAVQAYSKINAHGQWVDQSQQVNLNELFDQMSMEELEEYAKSGSLPEWFSQTVGATGKDSTEGERW